MQFLGDGECRGQVLWDRHAGHRLSCLVVLQPLSGPSHFVVFRLPVPEILTLKSNFNNLINYIMRFISWSE